MTSFSLRQVKLRPGEQYRDELELELSPLQYGGQRYIPVPEKVPAELEITRENSAPPGRMPPDAKAIMLGQEAFERALGTRPLLVRAGGTLPIVPALEEKGIATVVTGFALPESAVHSPNERMRTEDIPRAVAAAQELFRSWASLA